MMGTIFEPSFMEELRAKASNSGIESLTDKELQILIGDFFNHRISGIERSVRRMCNWGVTGLWAIALGIIANLVVVVLLK